MKNYYDVAIVGAGMSGSLMASRIHEDQPEWNILLLEKEALPGGRLRQTCRDRGLYSYGLNAISQDLLEFLESSLTPCPHKPATETFLKRQSFGVLAANKMTEGRLEDSFSPTGARTIAGAAAARDWTLIDELASKVRDGKKGEQVFSSSWKGSRKDPSGIALEHLSKLYGIPDVWSTTARDVMGKVEEFHSSLVIGNWESLCQALVEKGMNQGVIDFKSSCRVAEVHQEDDLWSLVTLQQRFQAKRLVVAQNPWDAIQWLDKSYWPSKLLPVPSKARPVSVVLLTVEVEQYSPFPDVTLVPAEGVQIYNEKSSICLQVTLNFEMTLNAPDVVKAVKRLRRARKKLLASLPDLKVSGDHIALLPVAWSQPLTPNERKIMAKLDQTKFQSSSLVFCGDAYGPNLKGDQNLIESARHGTEALQL